MKQSSIRNIYITKYRYLSMKCNSKPLHPTWCSFVVLCRVGMYLCSYVIIIKYVLLMLFWWWWWRGEGWWWCELNRIEIRTSTVWTIIIILKLGVHFLKIILGLGVKCIYTVKKGTRLCIFYTNMIQSRTVSPISFPFLW